MRLQRRTIWIRLALIEGAVVAIGVALLAALAFGVDDATRALLLFVPH